MTNFQYSLGVKWVVHLNYPLKGLRHNIRHLLTNKNTQILIVETLGLCINLKKTDGVALTK